MLWADINVDQCQSCNPCQARLACKPRAIVKFDIDEMAYVELERCRGCGKCIPACSYSAITLYNPNRTISPGSPGLHE